MRNELILLAMAGSALAACAPLEQAPLVYSSRQQMGVHVAGGTADTPGLELSIGYKSLDAAYVPVAVAKHCPELSAAQCDKLVYTLQRITGRNDVDDSSTLDASSIADLREEIGRNKAVIEKSNSDIVDARAELREIAAQREELTTRETEIAAINARAQATDSKLTVEDAAHLDELKARVAELKESIAREEELKARIRSAEATLTGAQTRLTEDTRRLINLEAARNSRRNDVKEDAFSVYGSFDGDAGAGREEASLAVGKVFSTGVASQNITQGLREGAVLALRARCLEVVAKVAVGMDDAAARKKLMNEAGDICVERPRQGQN